MTSDQIAYAESVAIFCLLGSMTFLLLIIGG